MQGCPTDCPSSYHASLLLHAHVMKQILNLNSGCTIKKKTCVHIYIYTYTHYIYIYIYWIYSFKLSSCVRNKCIYCISNSTSITKIRFVVGYAVFQLRPRYLPTTWRPSLMKCWRTWTSALSLMPGMQMKWCMMMGRDGKLRRTIYINIKPWILCQIKSKVIR